MYMHLSIEFNQFHRDTNKVIKMEIKTNTDISRFKLIFQFIIYILFTPATHTHNSMEHTHTHCTPDAILYEY